MSDTTTALLEDLTRGQQRLADGMDVFYSLWAVSSFTLIFQI